MSANLDRMRARPVNLSWKRHGDRTYTCFVCAETWVAPWQPGGNRPTRCTTCRAADLTVERANICAECGQDFTYPYRGKTIDVCRPCIDLRAQARAEQLEHERLLRAETAALPDIPAWTGAPPFGDRALCAQTDPEAFSPERGGDNKPAKAMCRRCPVTGACLSWALDTRQEYGIWGATSPTERKRILRDRRVGQAPNSPLPPGRLDQVAQLTALGESAREIADVLGISPRQVCRDRKRIRNAAHEGVAPRVLV